MDKGFLPLSRQLFGHGFWKERRVFSRAEAWIDLIQVAQFEDDTRLVRGKIIPVKRGELVGSLRFLGDRWDWSPMKVDRFLKTLESETMITQETRHGENVITLTNYDAYNTQFIDSRQTIEEKRDSGETVARQWRDSETPKTRQVEYSVSPTNRDTSDDSNNLSETEARQDKKEKPPKTRQIKQETIKTEGEDKSSPVASATAAVPYAEIRDLFLRLCPSLPKIREIADHRQTTVRSRWNAAKSAGNDPLARFTELFTAAEASDFLSGRSSEWAGCSFDWLMMPKNAVKVLEGNYANDRQRAAARPAPAFGLPPKQVAAFLALPQHEPFRRVTPTPSTRAAMPASMQAAWDTWIDQQR